MMILNLVYFFACLAFGYCDEAQVIGGSPIKIEEAPYMAIFRPVGAPFHCAASIINEKFLVTAAHCVTSKKMFVTVGTDKILNGGQRYMVEKLFPHPEYNQSSFDNDIAVIKLKKNITFNSRVQPIKLAQSGDNVADDAVLRIVGFGATETRPVSLNLLTAKLPHVVQKECQKIYEVLITDRMICAGGTDKGGCRGDSGGPLVDGDKLVGVVSFGTYGCRKATVFSRVSAHRNFIDKIISNN